VGRATPSGPTSSTFLSLSLCARRARILFGRLCSKGRSKFQGKASASARSSIVLRFLAGCQAEELGMFIRLLLEPLGHHAQGTAVAAGDGGGAGPGAGFRRLIKGPPLFHWPMFKLVQNGTSLPIRCSPDGRLGTRLHTFNGLFVSLWCRQTDKKWWKGTYKYLNLCANRRIAAVVPFPCSIPSVLTLTFRHP